MKSSGIAKAGIGVIIGWGTAFLFDPDRGRARRAQLWDQARGSFRRRARTLERRVHYQRGRLTGARHRLRGHDVAPPADDHTLVDRVRSHAFGKLPDIARRVSVDAADGIVTLRGELARVEDIERLVGAVEHVPGVEAVTSLLHLPDEIAPNKADAMRGPAG